MRRVRQPDNAMRVEHASRPMPQSRVEESWQRSRYSSRKTLLKVARMADDVLVHAQPDQAP
jgi:hypothetical protein